ncbi:hypothetical protein [uncultured Desulfosarcina sp.]|uniref:hypothetical protein n=1 Tax=uncultured Desulfosarcina sp. TaxID=218289 RepID=UPI0029C7EEEA|nr:hypothetical protein [uncultured Desulfosarcina sp.]
MKNRKRLLLFLLSLPVLMTGPAFSGDFDGSNALTGSVDRLIEINRLRVIEGVDPDTVGLPEKFIIDFRENTLRGTPDSLVRRVVRIKRIEHIEDKLILLGADEGMAGTSSGLGWSLSIEKPSGKAVLSAAGSGIAYVAFGTCTPIRGGK